MVLSLKVHFQLRRPENINFLNQFKEALLICCKNNINIPEVKRREMSSK